MTNKKTKLLLQELSRLQSRAYGLQTSLSRLIGRVQSDSEKQEHLKDEVKEDKV